MHAYDEVERGVSRDHCLLQRQGRRCRSPPTTDFSLTPCHHFCCMTFKGDKALEVRGYVFSSRRETELNGQVGSVSTHDPSCFYRARTRSYGSSARSISHHFRG